MITRPVSWHFARGGTLLTSHAYIEGVCVCPGLESRGPGDAAPDARTRCLRCERYVSGHHPARASAFTVVSAALTAIKADARSGSGRAKVAAAVPSAPASAPRFSAGLDRRKALALALLAQIDAAGHGDLARAVARRYRVDVLEMLSDDRHAPVAFARFHLMWELRELGYTLPEIGRAVGRDHTTVLAGLRKFARVCGLVQARPRAVDAERSA